MKKLLYIVLVSMLSLSSCDKNDNIDQYENTTWSTLDGNEVIKLLSNNSCTYKTIQYSINNFNIPEDELIGDYTLINGNVNAYFAISKYGKIYEIKVTGTEKNGIITFVRYLVCYTDKGMCDQNISLSLNKIK